MDEALHHFQKDSKVAAQNFTHLWIEKSEKLATSSNLFVQSITFSSAMHEFEDC
jgi:hypothetical protein